jgi:ribonuclease D
MSYRTIRDAQQATWPAVQASLERHKASRAATEALGKAATAAAKARARTPWNRVVANETVWALAKADLLNSKEQAAVLTAAREWAHDLGPELLSYPDDFDQVEHNLYRAVQVLIASPEIDIDE